MDATLDTTPFAGPGRLVPRDGFLVPREFRLGHDHADPPAPVDWPRAWEAAGIALVHPRDAWFQASPTGTARLQAAAPLRGTGAAPGELVLIVARGDAPLPLELRRATGSDESPLGDLPSLRLGPPVPRREWPAALRAAAVPPGSEAALAPRLRRRGGRVELLSETGEVAAAVEMPDADVESVRRRLEAVASRAAAIGAADARSGAAHAFRVERSGEGPRAWLLVASPGGVLDRFPRKLLDRRPPPHAEAFRAAAEASYAAAHDDMGALLAPAP